MPTARISKEVEFDAGHRVPTHGSKCRSPHGHRYRIRATCEGPIVDDPASTDHGMLVDFGDVKALLTERVHDRFDHAMIVWEDDRTLAVAMARDGWKVAWFPYVPTAENLARWCYELLEPLIADRFRDGLRLVEIAVWETPTSVAFYGEHDGR
jgi:6-pyruvoyltetrahydropterin/6-carboxytetrahydropterin synthase